MFLLWTASSLTSGFPDDGLFQGHVVNSDPHPGLSSFQLCLRKSALAHCRKKTFSIRPGGSKSRRDRNWTQLPSLTKPAKGDDVWMKVSSLGCHCHHTWAEGLLMPTSSLCICIFLEILYIVSMAYLRPYLVLRNGSLKLVVVLKRQRKICFNYSEIKYNFFSYYIMKCQIIDEMIWPRIVNLSDTLSATVLSLPLYEIRHLKTAPLWIDRLGIKVREEKSCLFVPVDERSGSWVCSL